MKTSITYVIVLLSVIFAGCSNDEGTGPEKKPARIRLLHFGYDVGPLDQKVNGSVTASGVTYGNSSGYKDCVAGQDTVTTHFTGNPLARISSLETLAEGNDYTAYAMPPLAAMSVSLTNDARNVPPGKARIKLVNAASATLPADDIGQVALRITGASGLLLGPIGSTGVTGYVEVASGKFAFTLERPAFPTWFIDLDTTTLASSGVYTLIVHGTLSDADAYPLKYTLYADNGPGVDHVDLQQAASTGKILFAHGVSGAPPINVAVDGTTQTVINLTFGKASTYTTLSAGAHTATISANATPILTNFPITIENRKAHTVLATGTLVPADVAPLILEDITTPLFSSALIRFVHAAPSTPDIDVRATLITGGSIPLQEMQGVGYRETSISLTTGLAFIPVSPTGTYTMRFMKAGTEDELFSQTDLTFLPGKIYTLWVGGSASTSTLKAYVITHNP
ncbi:MAG: DUF4397 domain-containing protein [bacterium]|nr:DUF4397 domain-containing protein [bacterium]